MFLNREQAGFLLVEKMKQREKPLRDPLVLAIPRGGVVIGAVWQVPLADRRGF